MKKKENPLMDKLIKQTENKLKKLSENNKNIYFKNRRKLWGYFKGKENGEMKKVKKELLETNKICSECKKKFKSIKEIACHRKDENKGYSEKNCVLMDNECHNNLRIKKTAK